VGKGTRENRSAICWPHERARRTPAFHPVMGPRPRPRIAAHWAALDDHFQQHAGMVDRFREAGRDAVLSMWRSQTNEAGQCLSSFEREALIERHCELFGTWPAMQPRRVRGVKAPTLADLRLVDPRIARGQAARCGSTKKGCR